MKRIGVTGASGFIGRHVADALVMLGAEPLLSVRHVATAPDGAKFVELDLAEPSEAALDALAACHSIIHLAWSGLPNYRSLHHCEEELPRQFAFLKSLVARGARSIVVAGTCFEYGMRSGQLGEETPCQPANPYALAKHTLHRELEFLQAEHPFKLAWARLFYMHGEGQNPRSLRAQFDAAHARGDAAFPMSGGEQVRDFLPVSEVAQALARLARMQADCGAVNVCSGRPVTVRALVEGWARERQWHVRLDLGRYPYPDYEPMAFWGRNSKLRALLGEA